MPTNKLYWLEKWKQSYCYRFELEYCGSVECLDCMYLHDSDIIEEEERKHDN